MPRPMTKCEKSLNTCVQMLTSLGILILLAGIITLVFGPSPEDGPITERRIKESWDFGIFFTKIGGALFLVTFGWVAYATYRDIDLKIEGQTPAPIQNQTPTPTLRMPYSRLLTTTTCPEVSIPSEWTAHIPELADHSISSVMGPYGMLHRRTNAVRPESPNPEINPDTMESEGSYSPPTF